MGRSLNPDVPAATRETILAAVSHEFGLSRHELEFRNGANGWPQLAWHVCLYLASVEANFGANATARAFGCNHRLVTYAARRIEERRDTPIFELVISRMLAALRDSGVLA